MGVFGQIWRKIRYAIGTRAAIDKDLAREIEFHVESRVEELEREGVPPAEARARAHREFGPASRIGEDSRAAWQFFWVEQLFADFRHSLRTMRRNPLFTTAAVLSLALGIGANTAVFTLLDQLVLRLLPVNEPERLVMVWPNGKNPGRNRGGRASSYPLCQDLQRKAVAFESVFCELTIPLSVNVDGTTERANAEMVSGNFFETLHVGPAVGRVFTPAMDDRTYKGHPSVVLSHDYWIQRFAGSPNVVGKKILVNNYPMEIVGVSAPGFVGLDPSSSPQIRVPIQMKPLMTLGQDAMGDRRWQWAQVFARLKPGYTVESARASLQPLFRQILEQELTEPDLAHISSYERSQFLKRTLSVETAATGHSEMRRQYSTALSVLMGMAGLILLIACSNVANLLIARAVARQKEIAVRLAIGAARRVLVRHLLVESVVLAMAGTALGLFFAAAATRGLLSMLPTGPEMLALRAEPDLRILLFSTLVALATALLFGLAPALQATRIDVWPVLKDVIGAVTGTGNSARLRKTLVTAQVALSFLLLVGAGLFARTLANLKYAHTGFRNIDNLITFQVDPAKSGYNVARMQRFYEEAAAQIRNTPGVKSAGYSMVPLLHGAHWSSSFPVEGYQARQDENTSSDYNAISPGYLEAMGVPLLDGRGFDDRDRADLSDRTKLPTVAIVNRRFAERYFGKQGPVGRHLGFEGPHGGALTTEIVGLVEDSLYAGPRSGVEPQVFFSYYQVNVPEAATFYVRTVSESKPMFATVRGILARLDGAVPVYEMKTLERQMDETLSTERLIASLSVVFGLLATVMAALGLYGVMAFLVARRTREIGLRMALGAPRGSVLWLVLREVLALVGAGLAIGLPCAYALGRYVSSQLFGVRPTDVWTGVVALAVLASVAAVSGFVPARRASSISPTTALRYE